MVAETEDGALRGDCAEEGLSPSMTASGDVLLPPHHDEEVFIADGEEKREMLRGAAWVGAVGSSFVVGCRKILWLCTDNGTPILTRPQQLTRWVSHEPCLKASQSSSLARAVIKKPVQLPIKISSSRIQVGPTAAKRPPRMPTTLPAASFLLLKTANHSQDRDHSPVQFLSSC